MLRLKKFLDILNRIGTHSSISQSLFTPDEYRALIRSGFLVFSSTFTQGSLSIASLPQDYRRQRSACR
ncbi:hypothetical protein N7451_012422 [Penicillium sp. IBT 35674x]|nr:hypothetical protein N7451_012422 [Penicillium sp. IBT 35674x]